ncbi:EF-hand domain-containing protein D2-like [Branchiostoma floridae x Branchiostoma belcheri]
MAENELADRLARQAKIADGSAMDEPKKMREYEDPNQKFAHPWPEFSDYFSREQCKKYEELFQESDEDKDGFISYEELKRLMEKRGDPMTHLELKAIIKEVDEDKDGKINMREWLYLWSKVMKGEMPEGSGLAKLVEAHSKFGASIKVQKAAGVGGAKGFFESKMNEDADKEKYQQEIQEQQRLDYERKRQEKAEKEAEEQRKAAFKARAGQFE